MKQNFIHLIKSLLLMYLLLATGTPKAYCQETIYQIDAYIKDGGIVFPTDVGYDGKIALWSNTDYVFWVQKNDFDKGWVKSLSGSTCNITDQGATISLEYLMSPSKGNPVNISEDFEACVFRINSEKDEHVQCCFKIESYDGMQYTFSISIHGFTKENGSKEATCTTDGYSSMICPICEEENRQIFKAIGHAFGEWQTMEGGRFRTCNHDESHIQYDMDATEVNTLEITLTDGTKLSYPQTLNPVVSFNDLDLSISFDTDKTSLVSKADIAAYNQVWPHNKNGYTQNEDKTYSHKCDYAGCGYDYNDLSVKNGAQYYAAEKVDGVIKVADMTLNDSEGYDCEADFTVTDLTYNRTFSNGYWQAVYVPFAINCDELPSDMEMAVINNFHEYEQEDGSYNVVLEVKRKTSGTIPALTPCVIRMKTAPAEPEMKTLSFSDAAFSAAADNFTYCFSVTRYYKFTGSLAGIEAGSLNDGEDFVLNLGTLYKANAETSLRAQRWYLSAIDRTGSGSASFAMPRSIAIQVIGDSDVTGMEDVHVVTEKAASARKGIFDLQGRRLNSEPAQGVYIKNGRKVIK